MAFSRIHRLNQDGVRLSRFPKRKGGKGGKERRKERRKEEGRTFIFGNY